MKIYIEKREYSFRICFETNESTNKYEIKKEELEELYNKILESLQEE